MPQSHWNDRDISLLELLDRALDKGVIVWGDLTLSVADVDLLYVGVRLLLTSVETAERTKRMGAATAELMPYAAS